MSESLVDDERVAIDRIPRSKKAAAEDEAVKTLMAEILKSKARDARREETDVVERAVAAKGASFRDAKGRYLPGCPPGPGNPHLATRDHYSLKKEMRDARSHLRRRLRMPADDPCWDLCFTVGDRLAKRAIEELERLEGMETIRGLEVINRDAYGAQVVVTQDESPSGVEARESAAALFDEAAALREQVKALTEGGGG